MRWYVGTLRSLRIILFQSDSNSQGSVSRVAFGIASSSAYTHCNTSFFKSVRSTTSKNFSIPKQDPAEQAVTPTLQLSHAEVLLHLVKNHLEQHASSVEIPYFKSPTLQLRELAPSVARIKNRGGLVSLVKEICAFAATDPERSKLVCYSLPHLLRLCAVEDKRRVLDVVLKAPKKAVRKRLAYGVVRSSATREALFSLLSPQRVRALVACGSRKLTEMVAKGVVLQTLQRITVPEPMWRASFKENNPRNRKIARARVHELEVEAKKGLQLLGKLEHLTHRPRSKVEGVPLIPARPLHEARVSFSSVARVAEKLRVGPRPTYNRLRHFVNSATRRLSLECSDGVRLLQSHVLPNKDLWTPRLVERTMSAFRLVPEAERLMTPRLREIVLSRLAPDGGAERACAGRIRFDYPGQLFCGNDKHYNGVPFLTSLLVHELGHSIQMGHEGSLNRWEPSTGEMYSPNNPLIDFKGFCDLSGWRVVGWFERSAFIMSTGITIEGREYPFNRPIQIDLPLEPVAGSVRTPCTVILRGSQGENLVFCHAPHAKFSLLSYAMTNPKEDFAEAFTEYILCPDRLIDLAPEKFHFMEIHFRVYRTANDSARLTAVQRALRCIPQGRGLAALP